LRRAVAKSTATLAAVETCIVSIYFLNGQEANLVAATVEDVFADGSAANRANVNVALVVNIFQ